MSKKLPEMYRCNFNKEIKNNENIYSTLSKDKVDNSFVKKENIPDYDRFAIEQKIFNIFNSKFPKRVRPLWVKFSLYIL